MLKKLVAAALVALAAAQGIDGDSLPTVDLGYSLHRASALNTSAADNPYYNFTNIRYARPPTLGNRWKKPLPPLEDRENVQDGSNGFNCPAANPAWISFARSWIPDYVLSQQFNDTGAMAELNKLNSSSNPMSEPPMDPKQNEDCLFLDVMAPQKVFDGRDDKDAKKAPVMVWIYGGGYASGSKTDGYPPEGLMRRAREANGGLGVVYVAMNYRLGAFGWLAGPTVTSDGIANAGLHDQKFALEWIQKNIHLFGGDPDDVTVFGESAGGGSIMHHLTAYAGREKFPAKRAILQSPGWLPQVSNYQLEEQFKRFMNYANVTSLEELRSLPGEDIIRANYHSVYFSTYSSYTYGPAVDGSYVPALPGELLSSGHFDKDVDVMVGHNAQEGLVFSNPFLKNAKQYEAFLEKQLPTLQQPVVDYINEDLYPPVYNGSYSYDSLLERQVLGLGEAIFICNTFYLDKAYGNQTYAYLFDVFPAIHGQDLAYTFYNDGGPDTSDLLFNTSIAVAMQDYITSFAAVGKPTSPSVKGLPMFKMYGSDADIIEFDTNSIRKAMDPAANQRCDWWQKALFV